MSAALRLVEGPLLARPTTREALEDVLAADDRMWGRFEEVCRAGLAELRESVLGFREALLAREHVFGSHHQQFEETFAILLGLAEELLPETPGAARGHLRERVENDVRPRPEGGVQIVGDVDARRAVEVVLAFEDAFFDETVLAAGSGHARLYLVARRIGDALTAVGHEYSAGEVEDELWMLVRELLPNAPTAKPDAERLWSLWTRTQEYVSAHDPEDAFGDERRQEHEVRALRAVRNHDLTGYRAALRDLCRAARDAAREKSGNEGVGGEE